MLVFLNKTCTTTTRAQTSSKFGKAHSPFVDYGTTYKKNDVRS